MNAARKADENGNLPEARRHLDNAISALIDPKPHTIHRDNHTTNIEWIDSLYDELSDAISGQTGERSGGQSTIPVWADILDLMSTINKQIVEWEPPWPNPDTDTPPAIARLAVIAARTWRPQDVAEIRRITAKLEAWCEEIRAKLSPEPTIYLMAPGKAAGAAACTACGTTYVWRPDTSENNKPIRQPALKVTRDGCHCQNCHATWEPGQLRLLAAALGYPLPAGVLE